MCVGGVWVGWMGGWVWGDVDVGGGRSLQCDSLVYMSPEMRLGHNLCYKTGTRTVTGPRVSHSIALSWRQRRGAMETTLWVKCLGLSSVPRTLTAGPVPRLRSYGKAGIREPGRCRHAG